MILTLHDRRHYARGLASDRFLFPPYSLMLDFLRSLVQSNGRGPTTRSHNIFNGEGSVVSRLVDSGKDRREPEVQEPATTHRFGDLGNGILPSARR